MEVYKDIVYICEVTVSNSLCVCLNVAERRAVSLQHV